MRRLRDIQLHPYGPSWGGRIADDEEPTPVGSTLPAATEANVQWARAYWPEADPSEFEFGGGRRGMGARHRETGVEYTIQTGMPIHELASGISTFVVRDGKLVLLQDRPDRLLHQGPPVTVTSRVVEYASPPEDGMVIY
jgi:hypothetical protein